MILCKIVLNYSTNLSSPLTGAIPYDLSYDYHKLITKSDPGTS